MSDREKKIKDVHDKMVADERDKMVEGGMSYEKAAREAEKLVGNAAEMLDRRDRDRGR